MLDYSIPTYNFCIPKRVFIPLIENTIVSAKGLYGSHGVKIRKI